MSPNLHFNLQIKIPKSKSRSETGLLNTLQFIAMPRVVKALFDAIDNISLTCLGVLEEMSDLGDSRERYQRLERLVDYNQKLLEALNVSHASLADICETVAEQGLHAKLTGAGGGG